MTRPYQILFVFVLAVVFSTVTPPPAPADDMVVFKNGHTLRADELELKDGAYQITTMAGGVMKIPVQLVEQVISCVVDKEVEEQRGTVPADAKAPVIVRGASSSGATRIPPIGAGGGGRLGNSPIGGGKATGGKAIGGKSAGPLSIPPRGARSPGKTGGDVSKPGGKSEKR